MGDTVGDRVGLTIVYQQVRVVFMIPTESLHEEAHARGGVGVLLLGVFNAANGIAHALVVKGIVDAI